VQRAVELHVGGQKYRVVSSASPDELERLARVVDDKLASLIPPGKPINAQSILLAAMALAHDLEEERRRAGELARDARTTLERIVGRVDDAIAAVDATVGRAQRLATAPVRSHRRGDDDDAGDD
jgi:cell division protein ZapA